MMGESGRRGYCREKILLAEEANGMVHRTWTRPCVVCLGNHRMLGGRCR